MKQQRNSLTIILMTSSILLLLVLQVFWLRGAYRDAEEDFRNETNLLFRNTIFAMHDSLIQRSLKPDKGIDSVFKLLPKQLRYDTLRTKAHLSDSVFNYINITDRTARVEIFSSSEEPDSLERILRPLVRKIQLDKTPKRFTFLLGPDSLKVDSIRYHYKGALDKAGIQATFDVLAFQTRRDRMEKRTEKIMAQPGKSFVSEVVPFNPTSRYAVSFTGIQGLLLREITPQIFFSIFLTLLTIGSFYMMYRNQRAQQKLMQIKNDFISNITHELKTPVATVSVALEALKNFHALDNPQRTTEYLEIAQNELSRLTLMTDKILKTAVYEDQGVELKIEEIDFDALIQEVLSSLKLVFEKRKISVSYRKEGTDFHFHGGAAHLTNVLYNLLDNALKYSGDGASIEVSLVSVAESLTLSVRDTGMGIASEYQKKIFEKFFRVPSGDVHSVKGYGLGLSYVASVVKSHKAEIFVESEPGKGSCFSIRFKHKLSASA